MFDGACIRRWQHFNRARQQSERAELAEESKADRSRVLCYLATDFLKGTDKQLPYT